MARSRLSFPRKDRSAGLPPCVAESHGRDYEPGEGDAWQDGEHTCVAAFSVCQHGHSGSASSAPCGLVLTSHVISDTH